jgi:histidyl-tRNA synthetase
VIVTLIQSQTQLQKLIETLQRHNELFGYQRLETDMIQPADLFLTKAGDQLIHRLFTFDRSGRLWALRPEFTASAAKAYAEQAEEQSNPARWQFAGAVFEDAPGSSQVQQRHSVGTELLGWHSPVADAETILVVYTGLRAAGVHDVQIIIGSVNLLRALLSSYDLDSRLLRFIVENLSHLNTEGKAYIIDRFDRLVAFSSTSPETSGIDLRVLLEKSGSLAGRTREDIIRRLQRKTERLAARSAVLEALDQLETLNRTFSISADGMEQIRLQLKPGQTEAAAVLDELDTLIGLLQTAHIPLDDIALFPTLARDWNYYTGMIFEARSRSSGRVLAGGGRYNELIRLMGGRDTPAVGSASYADAIMNELAGAPHQSQKTRCTLRISQETTHAGMRWADALRSAGLSVEIIPATAAVTAPLTLTSTVDGGIICADQLYSPDQLPALIALIQSKGSQQNV